MKFDLDNITRENVKDLQPYSSARDEYVSDGSTMVFLDANENPFENGVNRYPDPQQRSLKAVLAEQKGVTVENILLGNGSDEVLDLFQYPISIVCILLSTKQTYARSAATVAMGPLQSK